MPKYFIAVLFLLFLSDRPAYSEQTIFVALTSVQPPFIIDEKKEHGLTFDLLNAINELQDDYRFVGKFYPIKQLFANYEKHNVHLVALGDLKWGWSELNAVGSLSLTNGKDVFFSLKSNATDEKNKGIAAVRGFHYAFANFDPVELSQLPNISLVNDEPTVVKMVLRGRVGRGISSEAYLKWLSVSNPKLSAKLKIEPKEDHNYNRQFIVLPNSLISVEEINNIVFSPSAREALRRVFAKYGLPFPPN